LQNRIVLHVSATRNLTTAYAKFIDPFLRDFIPRAMSEEREGLSSSGRKSNSDTPADPSSAALERAFDKFRGYIDSRLENLAVSLQTAPQAPVESIHSSTRKLQREAEAQKLKYKANSKQFLHNAEVEDHVVAITQYLEKETPDAEEALETAKKALLVIQKRQKLIKLADKSEAGWLAVQEYESDELADGSDDEKRIKKAQEKGARKKRQLMQQQTKGKRPRYNSTASTSVRPEDRQLFRGKCSFRFLCMSRACLPATSLAYKTCCFSLVFKG